MMFVQNLLNYRSGINKLQHPKCHLQLFFVIIVGIGVTNVHFWAKVQIAHSSMDSTTIVSMTVIAPNI